MAIIPQNPASPAVPNDLTAESVGSPAVPNTLTGQSAASPAIPNTLAPESAAVPAIPNTLAGQSVVAPAIPNTLTADSAVAPAIPNTLTAGSVVAPAVPNTLASTAQTVFPRTLCPTVDLNYAAGLFSQAGSEIAQSDLVTYSRASSATFVDRYKKNNKYEYFINTDHVGTVENLIPYSEELTTGWATEAATVTTVNVLNPAGTFGAKKLVGDGASDEHALYRALQTLTGHTYSVYLKADGNRWALLTSHYNSAPTTRGAFFDLLTGSIGSVGAGISAKIENVGNDWYRCSITEGASPSTIFSVNLSSDGSTVIYADDAESGVLVWGAQRTLGYVFLPYVKTTSAAASQVFSESQRIEYNAATGESLGALIEQASTNLYLYSQSFENGAWIRTSSSVVENIAETLAPDLSTSSYSLAANSGSTTAPRIGQAITSTATNKYTASIYVKRREASFLQVAFTTGHVASNPIVNFDLTNGSYVEAGGGVIDGVLVENVGNDWYRLSVTATADGVNFSASFVIVPDINAVRLESDTWTIGDGIYIWGAQVEAGDVPTSYIKTEGSTVSRAVDVANVAVAGNVPSGDVTYFADVDARGASSTSRYIYLVQDTANNIYSFINTTDDLQIINGGTFREIAAAGAYSDSFKSASVMSRSSNTISGLLNGVETISGDAGALAVPDQSASIRLGAATSTGHLNGHIKRFTIYNEALTATEVSQL